MLTLVVGAASSGKSAFAEQVALSQPGQYLYLATMESRDGESLQRVERHRAQRAGKGFRTLEWPMNLQAAPIPTESVVLLEALTTLLANELYLSNGCGTEQAVQAILSGIRAVEGRAASLIVVSDLLFSDGVHYDPATETYRGLLGDIHRQLAACADQVVEVVYSIPIWWKGKKK